MKKLILALIFISFCCTVNAQTTITVDASVTYQTIQGFGSSDAWNAEAVGKYWDASVKETIAKKLFSKIFDANGNPSGIGLSRWRFNIGAGSAEQGTASNIEMPERRVECFLKQDGTYDWNKQSGQQWFLNQAKTYGVEQLVAFVNSPPRFFTKNGRANSDNKDDFGPTNLNDTCYDSFAQFLTNVLKHFEDNGTHFTQISPVNEPQFKWTNGQEGCPWTNMEIRNLVEKLNSTIVNKGLSTKILLAEASSFNDMHQTNGNPDKCDQIWKFFESSRPEYIGGFSQVLRGLGGHSYWTDSNDVLITAARENIYRESREQGNIDLYQTEYCLLSKDNGDFLANSIFLGKIIYADLSIANVSIWDYWTTMERERWSQKNRFYLIRLIPTGGDYADLSGGGIISIDKNLWVLGNYSFFIRPGYKRIKVTGANDLAGLMGSAFIAPDSQRIVVVYVNYGTENVNILQTFDNLPAGLKIMSTKSYVTDANSNLHLKSLVSTAPYFIIGARSVTTMVIDLEKSPTRVNQNNDKVEIAFNHNVISGLFQISIPNQIQGSSKLTVANIAGKVIYTGVCNSNQNIFIDFSVKPSGLYLVKIQNSVVNQATSLQITR